MAPAGFAQATDDAVHRGGYQLQDRGAAVVTGGGVQSSVINRSPGRRTRRGSLSSACGSAFDRLGDVEASQARHHIPSQRQFWDRNRCHRGIEAHAAVRRGPRPAMGREDLPLAGTEQAKADPDTRPLPDRSRTGMPSGPPTPAWRAGPRHAAGHLPVLEQGHIAQPAQSSAPIAPASAHTAGRGLARRPAQERGMAGSGLGLSWRLGVMVAACASAGC